ncbi:MAG: AAA family ATPase, partial [Patescibacteria group bacterium]
MYISFALVSRMEMNEQFTRALDLMEKTGKNVFITGRAGTGKSTLLRYFREHTKKKIVVLAPTGVAAVNVQGQTIHSFFRFKPDITLQKVKKLSSSADTNVYKKIDAIVIDEISMTRADILDCVDKFLRIHRNDKARAFGGVQMIFIGDLYQLPPVVAGQEKHIFSSHYESPYFFSARVFSPQANLLTSESACEMELVELEKVYRQTDADFIELLNAIRNNTADESVIARLNARYDPSFRHTTDDRYITLTTTNAMADDLNGQELRKLSGKAYRYTGKRTGNFDEKYLPTDVEMSLKIGAQVMMLNNDTQGRWINGTIGSIVAIQEDDDDELPDRIVVLLETGETVDVLPHQWDIYQFSYNSGAQQIESESVGSFTQYPLRLAWAVTIHKSQGKTFDRVIVDIGRGTFSPGQLYVALSRCTTMNGMVLKKPIQKRHIWTDWKVVKFLTRFQYQKSDAALSLADKVRMIEDAIDNEQKLAITYLKAQDVKSRRVIIPHRV